MAFGFGGWQWKEARDAWILEQYGEEELDDDEFDDDFDDDEFDDDFD